MEDVRRVLLVLLGSVALVLIAWAIEAIFWLARAAAVKIDWPTNTAGRRQRHCAQPRTESAHRLHHWEVLLAPWMQLSLWVVRTMHPGNIPSSTRSGIDGTVMAFTFGIALATGILFGLAPVWRAIKLDPNSSLKAGGRNGQADSGLYLKRHRLRGLLVVSELAISLVRAHWRGIVDSQFHPIAERTSGLHHRTT